jgi:hypothetical protein
MTLSAGSRLGPFEILSPLGAGGGGRSGPDRGGNIKLAERYYQR